LENDYNDAFTGICKERKHCDKLHYFCKTHNQLCCAACIAKIKGKFYGKHKDCKVCYIKRIKEEKKQKLDENIKYLEELSKNLEKTINELKIIFEKINKNKEELKLKIQKIFTQFRNVINNREDELLNYVNNKYDELFFSKKIIQESEKLPNRVKTLLEKGKTVENEWEDNNKLSSTINYCLNIEKNIDEIKKMNENIEKCNSKINIKVKFSPDDKDISDLFEDVKNFGTIICSDDDAKDEKIKNEAEDKVIKQ
jgi:DNA repair exonuclease SbcCD ATPase subunit